MKIKIDREVFAAKLKQAIKFIPDNALMPALLDMRFTVKDDLMEIISCDGHSQIKVYCVVKADGDVSFCLPGELLSKTIDLFRENEVIITQKDTNKTEIKCGKFKSSILNLTMPQDWPVMQSFSTPNELTLNQFWLKKAFQSTIKFVGDSSMKYNADGLNVAEINHRLVFTGLDGFVMCRVNVPVVSIASWNKNIIVPEELAKRMHSLLDDKGEITMMHDNNKIHFISDGLPHERYEVTSLTKEFKYPDTELLIKDKAKDYIRVNTLEIQDALRRLCLFSSDLDQVKVVNIKNDEGFNEVILTSVDNVKHKNGVDQVTIVGNTGHPLNKHFNAKQFLKVLANVETNEFILWYNESPRVACFIEPAVAEGEDNNFIFLLREITP